MTEESYPFRIRAIDIRYEFTSVSAKKSVPKAAVLSQLTTDIFNIALLDVLEDGTLSDDLLVTNNQDLRMVMATVMRIVDDFLTRFPDKTVFFQGSDDRRTRLYRIVIGRELHLIQTRFRVLGVIDEQPEVFSANKPYEGFYINKI